MAAESQGVVISINGDSKDFQKAMQDAARSVIGLGESAKKPASQFDALSSKVGAFDSISGTAFGGAINSASSLTSSLGTVGIALGGVAIAAAATFAAFKFAQLGEENEKISKNFSLFANQAGLDADDLKEKFAGIAEGFVDLEEVLPRAGEAINNLGKNAARLPELFQLAKNIGVTTGRDINEVFSQLTKGVENQNEKLLKNNLIRVDVKKATEEYAATLGVNVERLSETGKQQAILNAVLEKGKKNFGDNTKEAAPLAGGIKQLELAYDDLKDAIGAVVNSKLGQYFADTIGGAAIVTKFIANLFTPENVKSEGIRGEIDKVIEKIKEVKEAKLDNPAFSEGYNRQLNELNSKLLALEKVQKAVSGAKTENAKVTKDDATDDESEKKQKEKADKLLELRAEQNLLEQQQKIDHNAALAEIDAGKFATDEELANIKYNQTIERNAAELEATLLKNKSIEDDDERNAANQLARKKLLGANLKAEDDKNLILIKTNKEKEKTYDQLSSQEKLQNLTQTLSAISSLTSSSSEELFAIGKAAGIANATIEGIGAVQKALNSAPPPFNFVLAGLVGAASAANIAKIAAQQPPAKGALNGALVTEGVYGKDTEPFMLSRGEIVAPAKSFDEVIEGTARERGFVKPSEQQIENGSTQQISISIQGDFIGDENYINQLTAKIREAVQFRGAELT